MTQVTILLLTKHLGFLKVLKINNMTPAPLWFSWIAQKSVFLTKALCCLSFSYFLGLYVELGRKWERHTCITNIAKPKERIHGEAKSCNLDQEVRVCMDMKKWQLLLQLTSLYFAFSRHGYLFIFFLFLLYAWASLLFFIAHLCELSFHWSSVWAFLFT